MSVQVNMGGGLSVKETVQDWQGGLEQLCNGDVGMN